MKWNINGFSLGSNSPHPPLALRGQSDSVLSTHDTVPACCLLPVACRLDYGVCREIQRCDTPGSLGAPAAKESRPLPWSRRQDPEFHRGGEMRQDSGSISCLEKRQGDQSQP